MEIGIQTDYELCHHTPEVSVRIFNLNTNSTLATANLSTPSSGRTSIGINTYALGNESLTDGLVTAGPGATVESVNTSMSNETLPPGEYRVAVRSEQGLAATADETTVMVANRSTNGLTAYATADLDRSDLGTADAVQRAIANGTLSPTSTVTSGETVVYVANATGLTGLPAARNATPETGADLARLDGLAFGVRSNASTISTAEDDRTDANGSVPRNSSVHVDDRGLYLVADADDALATDETPADGEAFTAEFLVADERLREAASDPTGGHTASTTVTFETPPPDGEDGDSKSDGSLEGGGGEGGSDGGATGGDATGGGTSGGSAATGSGGTAGGRATGSPPETGSPPRGTKAGEAGNENGDGPRSELGRSGGRFGIRPVADVRTVARDDSTGSPASVSRTAASSGVGIASPGDGSVRSEAGAGRGDAGSDDTGAGSDEAARANGADAEAPASDGSGSKSDTAGSNPDTTDTDPATPSYDDAPIRTTAEDVPGFGPLAALVALLFAGGLAARRRDREA